MPAKKALGEIAPTVAQHQMCDDAILRDAVAAEYAPDRKILTLWFIGPENAFEAVGPESSGVKVVIDLNRDPIGYAVERDQRATSTEFMLQHMVWFRADEFFNSFPDVDEALNAAVDHFCPLE